MATCDGRKGSPGCGRRILWAVNQASGKRNPIDPDPVPQGNIVLDRSGELLRYRVLTKAELGRYASPGMLDGPAPDLYTSHFATCPNAANFRRCGTCHKTPCECAK